MKKDFEIERLQDNLQLIRKAGGWSGTEFGKMIGLSKQSIGNLEHKTVKMSKAQYIAIRCILDHATKFKEYNEVLRFIVKFCMNSYDIPEEQMVIARAYLEGAVSTGLNAAEIHKGLESLLGEETVQKILRKNYEVFWFERIVFGSRWAS